MTKRLFGIGLVLLACACAGADDASVPHTVSGTVVTPDGSNLANVAVEAVPIGGVGTVGTQHWVPTDKEGKFEILLKPARYQIRAKAEDDGYPDPNFLFSGDTRVSFPTVVVGDHNISDVSVVLGSRGAMLEGAVRDQHTGRPVGKAKVTISDAAHPQAYVEVFTNDKGQFHFTVPAKAIIIQATATGYNSSTVNGEESVNLASGERRHVDIKLEPASQDSH